MGKKLSKIMENNKVAIVCWKKMEGYQIKGEAHYITSGADFDEAVRWIAEILPDRVVRGLIILTPSEIYDISPGAAIKGNICKS